MLIPKVYSVLLAHDFLKIIHIELNLMIIYLSDERLELVMSEMLGQDFPGKSPSVCNHNLGSSVIPVDDFGVGLSYRRRYFDHIFQPFNELTSHLDE